MEQEACPRCGSSNVSTPGFTWYGGIAGPRMIGHRKCGDCRYQYVMGGTHKDLYIRIAMYFCISSAIGLVAIAIILYFMFFSG